MTALTRRLFMQLGGALLLAPKNRRDWYPAALWRPSDRWGRHS